MRKADRGGNEEEHDDHSDRPQRLVQCDVTRCGVLGKMCASNEISAKGAMVFGAALRRNISITFLDLSLLWMWLVWHAEWDRAGNHLGDEGAEHIAVALRGNITVKNVYLGRLWRLDIVRGGTRGIGWGLDNEIGDDGAECIARTLALNAAIKEINLDCE